MKGRVYFTEAAETKCPSCQSNLYLSWEFPFGTTLKAISDWTFQERKEKCSQLKEECVSCGYTSIR